MYKYCCSQNYFGFPGGGGGGGGGTGTCSRGGPLDVLNFNAGAFLNVFVDMTLPCSGEVSRWDLQAKQGGTFYAGVWRPQGGNSWMLVGRNMITVAGVAAYVSFGHIYWTFRSSKNLSSNIFIAVYEGIEYENKNLDIGGTPLLNYTLGYKADRLMRFHCTYIWNVG